MTALGVAVINIVRLIGWYHQGIWQKPLLWSLYIAFLGLCLSFFIIRITALARLSAQHRHAWTGDFWCWYDDVSNDD
ncbi:NnrS protein [Psychrobacter sp. JCM 18901]|nr:NnrS protein [Psychrobacter sp. JCM 18901]